VVKTSLLGHIKHPYTEKLRDAIRKHVDSYSKSIAKASSGLMHLAREMYEQMTQMETVEIPGELFDKTSFRYLMHGTAGTWRENVLMHTLHENFAVFRFEGARRRGDSHIYTYGAMKYITNLKNHLTENLACFMIRTAFALNPGISRKGIWSIISGITKDRQHEDDVEFVDKKTSKKEHE